MVPDESKYTVAGDTRYDHVYNRGIRPVMPVMWRFSMIKKDITIIAGSTWPADEKHILPALAMLCSDFPDLQVIIVPHELHESHLRDIETVFDQSWHQNGQRFTEFSGIGTAPSKGGYF